MSAFDGAGPEYKPPSYRTVIVVGLVIVILITLVLVGESWLPALFGTSGSTPGP